MKIPPLTHTLPARIHSIQNEIKLNKYVKRNGTVDTQIPRKKSRRRRMSRIPFYFVAIQTVWTNNTHCPVWISRSQILWCLLLVGRATAAASTNGKRYYYCAIHKHMYDKHNSVVGSRMSICLHRVVVRHPAHAYPFAVSAFEIPQSERGHVSGACTVKYSRRISRRRISPSSCPARHEYVDCDVTVLDFFILRYLATSFDQLSFFLSL